MKNIRTISRGNNGVALQFAAKKSSSELNYIADEGFVFGDKVSKNTLITSPGIEGYSDYNGTTSETVLKVDGTSLINPKSDDIIIKVDIRKKTLMEPGPDKPVVGLKFIEPSGPGSSGVFNFNFFTSGVDQTCTGYGGALGFVNSQSEPEFSDFEWHSYEFRLSLGNSGMISIDGIDRPTLVNNDGYGGAPTWGTVVGSNNTEAVLMLGGVIGANGPNGYSDVELKNIVVTIGGITLIDTKNPLEEDISENTLSIDNIDVLGETSIKGGTSLQSVEFLSDAPADGNIYGRKDSEWVQVEGSEGIVYTGGQGITINEGIIDLGGTITQNVTLSSESSNNLFLGELTKELGLTEIRSDELNIVYSNGSIQAYSSGIIIGDNNLVRLDCSNARVEVLDGGVSIYSDLLTNGAGRLAAFTNSAGISCGDAGINVFDNGEVRLTASSEAVRLSPDGVFRYNTDKSSLYDDRSVVDKAYVDAAIAAAIAALP